MSKLHEANPHFIHHQQNSLKSSVLREIIFGAEDGMVSTMGAITGIAAGTQSHFVVLLSGFVIVGVESISMAVGSYLSSKSENEIDERKIEEETVELKDFPDEEESELYEMYVKDGWPENMAKEMSKIARGNSKLFLQEMSYRELKIIPEKMEEPLENGIAMGVSYILGGSIPLIPYLIFSNISIAIPVSVITTLLGLFILGALTTKYTKRTWWRSGLEMFGLASLAALVGYLVSGIVRRLA